MESLSVFTAPPIIPAPAWGWRFASASSNAPEAESGWNLSPDEVQRFSLPSRRAEAARPESSGKAPCILLIEDNPADAGLVREALQEHQVRCELVLITNGERAIAFIGALDTARDRCPDLVILDLNLPKRPGREVLEAMRRSPRFGTVPVIVLTSSDNEIDRSQVAALGASRYIRKPSRLNEFMQLGSVFKEVLGQSGLA